MTSAAKIAWDDTILPFQLDGADVRGRVVRLDSVLEEVLRQHNYPAQVEALVAEAVLLTAMIGQTVKKRWRLSLQIRGNGPVRLIATDYYAPQKKGDPAQVRAYASFDKDRLDETASPFSLLGKGMFAMLIDQGDGQQPYSGITPLAGGSLASCAETYFAQSEQLPSRFALTMAQADGSWRGGAVMLQHMPKASPFVKGEGTGDGGLLTSFDLLDGEESDNWNRATILLESVQPDELLGPEVSPDSLLVRLFHEESPRIFDAQSVRFGCTCGPDKVRQAMSIYSAKDIGHMTTDDGKVTADCQFCGSHYEFDPQELGFEATK